jgi:hypothetical protein
MNDNRVAGKIVRASVSEILVGAAIEVIGDEVEVISHFHLAIVRRVIDSTWFAMRAR